jgi:predicted phosphodiesterase
MGLTVAALYDVHGNLPALEAVLAEPDVVAADAVVFGGDLVWGPWPAECLERAESLGDRAHFVRGNCETLVLGGASADHSWARDRLGDEQRTRISCWPATLGLDVDGLGPTLFCHATPRSEEEILTPASPEGDWRDALPGVTQRTVVCGHTHLQFDFSVTGIRVVNPGSVGAPTVRPVAWWALLGAPVELRTSTYDTEGAIEAARSFLPDVTGFANWLRQTPSYESRVSSLA